MQIANELAISTGTPLLLNRELPPEELLRALRRRLDMASRIVRATNPCALIVIIIDAADNSIAAAEERGESSFVPDLVNCKDLPKAVRLVVTARSHRRSDLKLPKDTDHVLLMPFEIRESSAHLRAHFPLATDAHVEEFHRLSRQIPRVQGYAINLGTKDILHVIDALRPSGKTVEGLIEQQLDLAAAKLGSAETVAQVFRAMLALPRPIPIALVATLANTKAEVVEDLCIDAFQGLLLRDGLIRFRDEDFETHLQQRFSPGPEVYEQLALLLFQRSNNDSYAAEHVADVLRLAGQKSKIISLLEDQRQPAAIEDPVLRQEVFARRARLALEATLETDDRVSLLKSLFVVADASKVDHAVENLLLANADLACRHGNPASVHRLYLNAGNRRVDWYGPTHLLCAANFSRVPQTLELAREHFKSASAWIRRWSAMPDAERDQLDLSTRHIALGTEAALRIFGLKRAVAWLRRWRPPSVVIEAVQHVCHAVVETDGKRVFEHIGDSRLRADVATMLVAAAMDVGIEPPTALVARTWRTWLRFFRKTKGNAAPILCRAGIVLCEASALHGIAATDLSELVTSFLPAPSDSIFGLSSDETTDYWDTVLRGHVLHSLVNANPLTDESEILFPPHLRKNADKEKPERRSRNDQERRELRHFLRRVLPAYTLNAQQLLQTLPVASLLEQVSQNLSQQSSDDWEGRRYDHSRSAAKLRGRLFATIAVRHGSEAKELIDLIRKCLCDKYDFSLAWPAPQNLIHPL
jgi:hypothetical protein